MKTILPRIDISKIPKELISKSESGNNVFLEDTLVIYKESGEVLLMTRTKVFKINLHKRITKKLRKK